MYWLIAIILSTGAGYWVFIADKKRAVPYPWISSLLRSVVVFFTILLILVPSLTITKNVVEKPVIVLLQDNSSSIAGALGNDSAIYRKDIETLTNRLSGKYKVVRWGFGNIIRSDSIFQYKQPATDIAAALTRAQEFFGMQNLGAVILATDGRFNQGLNPLFLQSDLHNSLYTVGIGDSAVQKDIRIAQAHANKIVTLNSNFEIRADIIATICKGYNNSLLLKEGDQTISSVPLTVNSDKYDRSFSFTLKADKPGIHHYIIKIPEMDGEKNTSNNRKDIFVDVVDEKKNILIASAAPHPDINAIKEALAGLETYKITVCNADNFPYNLEKYNAVILHGLPSFKNNFSSILLHAQKPVWLILNNQANYQVINDIHKLTNTTVSPAPVHNILSVYNPAFNAFTMPQNVQSVMDKMPPLSANVGEIQAAPGTLALFEQKKNANEGATPTWVLEQGNVPSAFLLGEGLWRWRLYEYKTFNNHDVIDECIRQTVAFLCANNNDRPFTVSLPKYVWSDQEAIALQAYLLNANHEQINTPDATIVITDSAGHKQEYSLERSGSGYNLNIGIHAGGNYTYMAKTTYNSVTYTATGSFVVETVPLELMESGADYPLLYSLAKKYNGGFVASKNVLSLYDSITQNEQVKPIIRSNTETVPLVDRKWYFFIILLFAVGEWLLRKYWLAQ